MSESEKLAELEQRRSYLLRDLEQQSYDWKKRHRYKEGHTLQMKAHYAQSKSQLNEVERKIKKLTDNGQNQKHGSNSESS